MKYYAGIGSRTTPEESLAKMRALSARLRLLGYTLRSGGAIGADQAFEEGLNLSEKEILRAKESTTQAEVLAETIHPAWHNCSAYAKRLHGRNCQIILGKDLNLPVEFVVCWTPDPDRGGTRTGIVLAQRHSIPVFNLFDPEQEAALEKFIKEKEDGKPNLH